MGGIASAVAGVARTLAVLCMVAALVAALIGAAPPATAAVAAKIAPSVVSSSAGVAITGDGLSGTTGVTFLGSPGPDDDVAAEHFVVVDAKKVVAQVPPGASSGPVALSDGAGTVATDPVTGGLTIVPRPQITALSAVTGKAGDIVTISGTHLLGSKKPKIMFGAKSSAPLSASTAVALTVKVPAGVPGGPTNIDVVTDGGKATAQFYIAPVLKGVAPKAGTAAGGSVVTITGSGFRGVDKFVDDPETQSNEALSGVTVGGVPVTRLVAVSDTEIVVRTPAGSSAAAPVVIRTTDGTTEAASTNVVPFEYQPTPSVTSVSQNWNIAGGTPEPVTFTGVNLSEATAVKVGAVLIADKTVDPNTGAITIEPPASVKAAPAPVTFTNLNAANKAFSVTVPFAYIGPPTVTKLDVVTGPAGKTVTVSGTNFTDNAEVRFGDAVASCTIVSFAAARCVAPPGSGPVPVTVVNPAGTSAVNVKATYTYAAGSVPAAVAAPKPVVSAFLPAYGVVGSTVIVSGGQMQGATAVAFSGAVGTWVDAPNFLVVGPGRLAVTVPSGVVTGPVRVTTPAGTTRSDRVFTAAARPAITSIDVVGDGTYGVTAGDLVQVKGVGLVAGTVRPAVTIGGKPAPILSRPTPTATTLVVQVPGDVGGRQPLRLTTPLGSTAAEVSLYYVPFVKALKPVSYVRTGAAPVTITGVGFTGVGNFTGTRDRNTAVTFDGVAAERFVVMSDKEIIAVPAVGSASADPLLVTSEHDAWVGSSDDRVRNTTLPVPAIAAVSPNTGTIGAITPVTITGANLRMTSTVLFGGEAATVTSAAADGTSMVVVPPGRTDVGAVTVTVTNVVPGGEVLTESVPNAFLYQPTPTMDGLTPSSGFTGSTPPDVTITGLNLKLDTVVRFGGNPAAVRSAAPDGRSLVVTPPLSNAVGSVDVTVTNVVGGNNLTATAVDGYTYLLAPAEITGKSAGTALPGTTVTLTGSSFVDVSAVRFGAISAAFTVANPTTIFATVPTTPSGQQGAAAGITVINGTGQASTAAPATADDWIWDSHPFITGMSASTGAQGSTLTVTGAGFTGATAVRFGSIDAASYTVVDDSTITAVIPTSPSAGSTADVVVVARGLSSPEPTMASANDWTWASIAAVASMLPNPGAAGATITVRGSAFNGVRSLTVNGVDVTSTVVVSNSTTLTFVAPPRPGGGGANRVDKPVVIVNESGAENTADIDPATGKLADLFTWS